MNTLERWRNIVSRIDVSVLPVPLRLEVKESFAIAVHCTTTDRDRRGGIDLCWTQQSGMDTKRASRACDLDILRFARTAIHAFLRHEADEALMYEGKRVFDPHAEDGELLPL